MVPILDNDEITEKDIQDLISMGVEESINLEFKGGDSLEMTDKKKAEIAKDVSAFANSAGGCIIYGMNEKNHKADSISPIDGNVITKEWLEQVIQTRIQRKIDCLKIIPVRVAEDLKNTLFVVKIPESPLAPHMTLDKKFYKRYNFESVQMEEYEIRNLYNRKEKTKLIIDNIVTSRVVEYEDREDDRVVYSNLSFQIQNIGKAVERDYKLVIEMNFTDYSIKFDPLRNEKNFNHSLLGNNQRAISFFGVSPIFPDEILTIGNVEFGLLESTMEQTIKNGEFHLKLLYSNGIDDMKISIEEIINKTH